MRAFCVQARKRPWANVSLQTNTKRLHLVDNSLKTRIPGVLAHPHCLPVVYVVVYWYMWPNVCNITPGVHEFRGRGSPTVHTDRTDHDLDHLDPIIAVKRCCAVAVSYRCHLAKTCARTVSYRSHPENLI